MFMNKMIYAMGYIADNGDIILKGAYRDNDTDNMVFVTVGKKKVTADIIRVEAGTTELPTEVIKDICNRYECGRCPLDNYNKPYEEFGDDE